MKGSKIGSGSLANEGTSIRGMENKFFGLFVCVTGNFGVRKVQCYVCVQVRYLMDKCVLAKPKLHLFRQNTYLRNEKQIQS